MQTNGSLSPSTQPIRTTGHLANGKVKPMIPEFTPTRIIFLLVLLLGLLMLPLKAGMLLGAEPHTAMLPGQNQEFTIDSDTSGTAIQGQADNSRAAAPTTLVYPNPFVTDITIKLNGDWLAETTIKVYNAIGVLAQEQKMVGSEYSLDLSELPAGIYFLVLTDGKNSLNRRLLKK